MCMYDCVGEHNGELRKKDNSQTKITTPDEASIEFGILLRKVIIELKKNETESLEIIKDLCPHFTAKNDKEVLLFSEAQLKAINACDDIKRMFNENLRGCFRWDDLSLLETLVKLIGSSVCKSLLCKYQQSLNYKMKLKEIYEHCREEKSSLPEGYSAMVAIIKGKNFFDITLEEYNELKEFTSKHCGVDSSFLSPFAEASPYFSMLLKWFVPLSAVSYMVKMTSCSIDLFVKKDFLYLKISSVVIFDKRNNVRTYVCYLQYKSIYLHAYVVHNMYI